MLSTTRVNFPVVVENRLRTAGDFIDNIMEFARDDLVGFRRPIAATFALATPLFLAVVYNAAGLSAMLEASIGYFLVAGAGIVLVGRDVWPRLVAEFETRAAAKRKALADLKCGFTESGFLNLLRSPRFFAFDHGVLAFADAGDFRTLFFWITNDPEDPRWEYYVNGELNRRIWRWLRLPVSREMVRFSTEGSRLVQAGPPGVIESIDAWEAIHTALGEPMDGALIPRPFDEVVETVERLL
ncbi:MAG: hypothetical protein R3C54_08905 [Parvularculaceae bacterium]|nr:hypothetical protein [Caulobacterales bacterium]HRX38894.1 hypothetical protein [Parvularculaceae bacterium]